MTTVAIVQAAPAFHDREATLDLLERHVAEAARQGAQLVAFPESWIPGYPAWLDCSRDIALWDHEPTKGVFAELRRESVAVPGPATERIAAVAAKHRVVLNVTVQERVERGPGNGTLYNTMLTFDADGSLLNAHRKLMPTSTERLIWGQGDGRSLHAVDTAVGRVSGLICWEHWMPLPRQILHDSGEQIHIAAWPQVKEMNLVASRHYAFEGRCFVLATGAVMRAGDLPAELERAGELRDDDALVLRGGSCVISPSGEVVAGPVHDREELLVAEIDLEKIDAEQMTLDTSGHYARPDLFDLRFGGD